MAIKITYSGIGSRFEETYAYGYWQHYQTSGNFSTDDWIISWTGRNLTYTVGYAHPTGGVLTSFLLADSLGAPVLSGAGLNFLLNGEGPHGIAAMWQAAWESEDALFISGSTRDDYMAWRTNSAKDTSSIDGLAGFDTLDLGSNLGAYVFSNFDSSLNSFTVSKPSDAVTANVRNVEAVKFSDGSVSAVADLFITSASTTVEIESNDSISTANLLTSGVALEGQASSSRDKDYFKVAVSKDSTIKFSFEPPSDWLNLYSHDINIYDGNSTLQRSYSTTEAKSYSLVAQTEGFVYVSVSSFFNRSDYKITALVEGGTPAVKPTYSLLGNGSSTDEGSTATFTLTTKNVTAGTAVPYTISGVSAADVSGGLSGTAVINSSGAATISATLLNDKLTEGAETLTVTAGGASASTTVNDTSKTVVAGNTVDVIVDLFGTVSMLKGLIEVDNGTVHTLSYNGTAFNYAEIDPLITTVVRNGEFTAEFAQEIAEAYPSAAGIKYNTVVSLVGAAAIDDLLMSVAGADGSYVS